MVLVPISIALRVEKKVSKKGRQLDDEDFNNVVLGYILV